MLPPDALQREPRETSLPFSGPDPPIMSTPLPSTTPPEILAKVRVCIQEVVGEAWADEIEIQVETSFSEDLELESIELVALSEKLAEKFGAEIDFVGWLSGMELDAILGLTVGDVVEHIEQCH